MNPLRNLPAIDKLLNSDSGSDLVKIYGKNLTTDGFRETLNTIRTNFKKNSDKIPPEEEIIAQAQKLLFSWSSSTLRPVINATGVVIHTNLGRAPLSEETISAMAAAASGYSNLEFDLNRGKRGSRYVHAEKLITRLTGAEAALVVNNNAAAILLVLSSLANRRRVVISRTQLVEIGGGFRIPDVLRQSGAKLVEIGATNRVHLHDYEKALSEQPIKLVLSAHQSNFRIIGFSTQPATAEVAALAHQFGVPYVDDLGSGTFLNTEEFGLEHEPTVQETLAAGVDLVTFSGDKLLGGPQAGIIAGRADLLKKITKHPLARAVRADKTTYAGLSATLVHYLKGEAVDKIPIWRMIAKSSDEIKQRARHWANIIRENNSQITVDVVPGKSAIGGGSLPGETLPSYLVALKINKPDHVLSILRSADPPVIARTQDDKILLDPRTVLSEQENILLSNLITLL